jgi:hypothetical protein
MNREWYAVEASDGHLIDTDLTQDQAYACAEGAACGMDGPVTVVRYVRTDVRTYRRQITVNAADVP